MWSRRRLRRCTQSSSTNSGTARRAGARASGLPPLPPHEFLEGSIDDLKRPFVRIEAPGFSDPLVAFIDTGFNGAILIDEQQATTLGFQLFRQYARVRL